MGGVTILGISPGTRYIGIALQRNGILYDWRIKSYKGVWSEEKLLKVVTYIETLIVTHVVEHIACKIPHMGRCSEGLKLLIEKIKSIAKKCNSKIHLYSIAELKALFTTSIQNKGALVSYLAETLPELRHLLKKEMRNKNTYYVKVFEAIATTVHCHNSLK